MDALEKKNSVWHARMVAYTYFVYVLVSILIYIDGNVTLGRLTIANFMVTCVTFGVMWVVARPFDALERVRKMGLAAVGFDEHGNKLPNPLAEPHSMKSPQRGE